MKSLALLSLVTALVAGSVHAAEPASFSVKVSGHGQPMILIPGLACSGDVWDATVARFSDRYECHVLTLAGFAGTPARPLTGSFMETVQNDLVAYVREQRLERPVVVGHSLGGFLALDLAAKHPELPGRLVVVDSLPFLVGIMKPGATAEDAQQMAAGASAGFRQMSPEAYGQMIRSGPNGSTMAASTADQDRIIAWGLASDRDTVAQAMAELYRTDLRPLLPQIACPTLVFAAWIGYAPYSSHAYAEQVYGGQYAGLKQTTLKVSDTARHFIMWDEPEWLFTQIENFLATPAVSSVSSER